MFNSRPLFPSEINIHVKSNNKKLKLKNDKCRLAGLNKKSIYIDANGNEYIAKVEKDRRYHELFPKEIAPYLYHKKIDPITQEIKYIFDEKKAHTLFNKHKISLQDRNTCLTQISSSVAKYLFKDFVFVPESYLTRLINGSVILSKKISPRLKFCEFLSEAKVIQRASPKEPKDWNNRSTLPSRNELKLSKEQLQLLGKIYFIALFMGHWDIVNNINLTNSGSVFINGKLFPVIVDWGNCLGVGFSGYNDSSAFFNYEFSGLNLPPNHSISGFQGCVPFDSIVYPRLPRQLVPDLFDLSSQDDASKAVLAGFVEAFELTKSRFTKKLLENIVVSSIEANIDRNHHDYFQHLLDSENITANRLAEILEGRLKSLEDIVNKLKSGESINKISNDQFEKISQSQIVKPRSKL